MNQEVLQAKVEDVIRLCNDKIQEDSKRASNNYQYDSFEDGRIHGQAFFAREILSLLISLNR